MAKVALHGGAYQAHSVIASAQRSLNLYSEPMPEGQGEPMPAANYPTPGTTLLGTIGAGPIRGIRQCTTGGIYVVSGSTVYSVDPTTWAGTSIGTITPGLKTPVSMCDNGLDMLIVDGTANGWDVNLAANTMAAVSDPSGMFSGADRVDYLDTYFILNKPNTPQFYISGSLAVTFDPLDFANKESYSDELVTLVVARRELYLLGNRTTEIWYDAGATDTAAGSFPFAEVQGVFIDHGIVAKYSVGQYDNSIYWLTRDRQGQGIVMTAAGYETKRVSTYAIEAELRTYPRIDDAIGFTYQIAGHTFYVLTFPHADHTWVYDVTTGLWHEWLWIDTNGTEHRHRANCFCAVNDTLVVGDWQNGNLYALDQNVFTDNGQPIKRVRSFPHMLADGKRVFYRQFLADMETGNAPQVAVATPSSAGFAALPLGTSVLGAAYAVSADGSMAVGSVNVPGDTVHRVACYWSGTSAPVIIGPSGSEALAVSADGSVIVGYSGSLLFRWTAGGGLVPFGTSSDGVFGMSADASRIIGSTGGPEQACYWNSSGTRTNLGFLAGHDTSRATGVSADGSFIVGQSYLASDLAHTERAWRWTAGGGMVSLGIAGAATGSRATSVSDDGVLVTGGLIDATGGIGAFSWTPTGGMVAIALSTLIVGTGVSGDGSTIIGSAPFTGLSSSYFGYMVGGSVTVPAPPSNPTDPAGANGTYPDGVSADGRTMVGYSFGTNPLPWIYRLSEPLVAPPESLNLISLRWSDDRGHSWCSPVTQDIGEAGEYRTSLQWQRLAYARDRCFEISWSVPMKTSLQGCFVDVTPAQS